MRKAIVAGAAAVTVVVLAFVVAPVVWSQGRPSPPPGGEPSHRERRVVMLDGRGSAIGVSVKDIEARAAGRTDSGGVVVDEVEEGSPASKAGIQSGDVIVDFDGERVRSARQFGRLVQETPGGRTVRATLVRSGSRQTVEVTPERGTAATHDVILPDLDEIERHVERGLRAIPRDFALDFNWNEGYPSAAVWPRGRLGAQLTPLSDQLAAYFGAKDGVLVSSVDPDSAAAKAGLKAGDVITTVDGRTVDTPRDVIRELRETSEDKDLELGILRDKKPMTLKAQVRPAR